jgi:hypothetical protein
VFQDKIDVMQQKLDALRVKHNNKDRNRGLSEEYRLNSGRVEKGEEYEINWRIAELEVEKFSALNEILQSTIAEKDAELSIARVKTESDLSVIQQKSIVAKDRIVACFVNGTGTEFPDPVPRV